MLSINTGLAICHRRLWQPVDTVSNGVRLAVTAYNAREATGDVDIKGCGRL